MPGFFAKKMAGSLWDFLFFILKKILEILGHFSLETQKPHSVVLYQEQSNFSKI